MIAIPKGFRLLDPKDSSINPFTAIGSDWMLVTAGDRDSWNTMTAAWGGLGFLWRKPVVFVFVRYSRYTYEFMERSTHFTCSFFGPEWKDMFNLCGTRSGRDTDKAAETGLEPIMLDTVPGATGPAVGFRQASGMIMARKMYSGELTPDDFCLEEIHGLYPKKDYHRMYIGNLEALLVRDEDAADAIGQNGL